MATLGHHLPSLRMRRDGARLVPASLPEQEPQDKLHCLSSNLGFLENKAMPEARADPPDGCGWEQGKAWVPWHGGAGPPALAPEAAVMLRQLWLGHVKG